MTRPVQAAVDGTPASLDALDWATEEAVLRGLPLLIVHAWVWEAHQSPASLDAQNARISGEALLASAGERASRRHRELEVSVELVDDSPRHALVELAERAEILVLGSRGSGGFSGLLVGSTSLHAAAHCPCPVVVVPRLPERAQGAEQSPPLGVVVGVHGREPSDELLTFAFEEALRRKLPLLVVHAWSFPLVVGPGHAFPPIYEEGHVADEEARLLSEVLAGWREKYPEVPVTEDLVRAGPAHRLVELSEWAQLVAVGRHGTPRGPVGRLGSVSQAVVQHARCPVAVVPLG